MKNKEKEKITYEKIEIDERTGEPIIVDVPIKQVRDNFSDKRKVSFDDPKEMESIGNQLIMNKVFGIEEEKPTDDPVAKKQALFKKITSTIFIMFVGIILGVTAYNDFFSGKKELPSFS
jgi:hypothetical protein